MQRGRDADEHPCYYRCEEEEVETGVGIERRKTFKCRIVMNGCPPFPEVERSVKKRAKECAARRLVDYLLLDVAAPQAIETPGLSLL